MKTRFAPTLLEWYDTNKRLLPWRETRDPYRIWISEIILHAVSQHTANEILL